MDLNKIRDMEDSERPHEIFYKMYRRAVRGMVEESLTEWLRKSYTVADISEACDDAYILTFKKRQ